MSTAAAISASLVNMRNVGTHKSVALTVHVPEELAQRIVDIFGWPTMSTPVPVAIARLNETPADMAGQDGEASPLGVIEGSRPAASPSVTEGGMSRRSWSSLRPSQQAAIRCGEPDFVQYLAAERHKPGMSTAEIVRSICGVDSRRELDTNSAARGHWLRIDTDYLIWSGKLAEPR